MTTLPAQSAPGVPLPVRASAPPAQSNTLPMVALDPVKLLKKYKWALIAATLIGGVLGTASHFALMKFYPRWRPFAIFEAKPPISSAKEGAMGTGTAAGVGTEEMNRFMQTEARIMVSQEVLTRAVEDPAIQREAPNWCRQFVKFDPATNTERFSTVVAARELADDIDARVIPQTYLIQLSMTYKHRDDATAIVRLVREKYMALLRERGQRRFDDSVNALRQQISSVENDIRTLQMRRSTLISSKQLDDVESRADSTAIRLQLLDKDLLEAQGDLQQYRKSLEQMEAEKNSAAGPQFGDNLESEADKDPVLVDIRGRISQLEAEIQTLIRQGFDRNHISVKRVEARAQGERDNMEVKRKEVLRKLFDGRLDSMRKAVESLEAKERELAAERVTLQTRLVELNNAKAEVTDLKRQIEEANSQRSALQQDLQSLNAVALLESANRVLLQQAERPPSIPDFPQLKVLIPAGMFITLALVSGILFLRELVDQRVKSPSDITILPRTRLVGWIPDASQDHAGSGATETAFRDRPKGVVAESFRLLRGSLVKRIGNSGHRTILVMSGMPGSGSTTVVSNLGGAFAASDKRVLLIDANFRRPALHRVMGLPEAPGLADALADGKRLEDLVQATSTPNLDLLSAGSRDKRIYERLSTQSMIELLASARAMYDIVLIDTSPALISGDGIALAQKCDASLLVVRAMSEKRGMVARIKNELSESRAEFLGVVVNAVKHAAGGYLKGNIKAAAEYAEE